MHGPIASGHHERHPGISSTWKRNFTLALTSELDPNPNNLLILSVQKAQTSNSNPSLESWTCPLTVTIGITRASPYSLTSIPHLPSHQRQTRNLSITLSFLYTLQNTIPLLYPWALYLNRYHQLQRLSFSTISLKLKVALALMSGSDANSKCNSIFVYILLNTLP